MTAKKRGALMFRLHLFRHKGRVSIIIVVLALVFTNVVSAADRYAVTADIANIRSGPGTNREILFEAEKYYPLKLLKLSGDWFQVEDFEGDIGWVHKSVVGEVSSVITIRPKCNIRTGPGMKNQIIFVAERGVPFMVIERQGKWIHVRHSEGHEGWIHSSLVW